ncbi:MAG: hypothetical protein ACLR9K_04835 [Blautia sp.]
MTQSDGEAAVGKLATAAYLLKPIAWPDSLTEKEIGTYHEIF